MAKFKVAMLDYDYASMAPIEEELAKVDAELVAQHSQSLDEAIALAKDADGVITQVFGPMSDEFFDALEKCRVICRCGIGLDPIDVASATRHGVAVTHVPSYCEDEVSDHAMALLLSCVRKTVLYTRSVRGGTWDWKAGQPLLRLRGRTIGLVGLGKIPRLLVPKAKGFGMDVIAFDPYVTKEAAAEAGAELVAFDELLERSDFISLHVPLTESTQHLIDAEALKKMKNSATLINTARGPVVDNAALAAALDAGEIAGAGLDVLEEEPPSPDNPLLRRDDVVLSPHAAYNSVESLRDLLMHIGRNTAAVLDGRLPAALANPEVAEKLGLK